MYIEIYGLSGSGKTTLAENYAKQHPSVKTMRRPKKLINLNLSVLLKTLKQLGKINNFLKLAELSKINLKKQKRALFISYYSYNLTHPNKQKTFFGHGFIQTLTQNKELRQKLILNENLLKQAVNILPLNHSVYIHLKTSKEIAVQRAKLRRNKYHSDEHYNEDELLINKIDRFLKKKIILKGNQNMENILKELQKKLSE